MKCAILVFMLLSLSAHADVLNISSGTHYSTGDGKTCTVRCVTPHKAAPKPILNRALWLCIKSQPLIIVLGASSIALNLNLPPDVPLAPESQGSLDLSNSLAIADEAPSGPIISKPEPDTGAYVGVIVGTGGGYYPAPFGHPIPSVRAPEIDPGFGGSAITLLCGALAVIRGKRRAADQRWVHP